MAVHGQFQSPATGEKPDLTARESDGFVIPESAVTHAMRAPTPRPCAEAIDGLANSAAATTRIDTMTKRIGTLQIIRTLRLRALNTAMRRQRCRAIRLIGTRGVELQAPGVTSMLRVTSPAQSTIRCGARLFPAAGRTMRFELVPSAHARHASIRR